MRIALQDSSIINQFFENGFVHIKNEKPVKTDELKNICLLFGELYSYPKNNSFLANNDREVVEISPQAMFGDAEMNWHKDMAHTSPWFPGTLLYCQKQDSSVSSITDFAYTLKSNHKNINTKHSCFSGSTSLLEQKKEKRVLKLIQKKPRLAKKLANFPAHLLEQEPIERPLQQIHPVTGETCYFVSPATQMHSEEGEQTGSDLVNDILFSNESFSHTWSLYDIIFFDNYKVMHRRNKLSDYSRKLLRIHFNFKRFI